MITGLCIYSAIQLFNKFYWSSLCEIDFIIATEQKLLKMNQGFECMKCILPETLPHTLQKCNIHYINTTYTSDIQHTLQKYNTHFRNTTHTSETQHTLQKYNTHFINTTYTSEIQHTLQTYLDGDELKYLDNLLPISYWNIWLIS